MQWIISRNGRQQERGHIFPGRQSLQQILAQVIRALRFVSGLREDILVQEALLGDGAEETEYVVGDLDGLRGVVDRKAEESVAQPGQESFEASPRK